MWINLSSILVLLFRTVIATPLVSSVNGLAGRDDSFMIGRSINTGGPSPIGNYLSNSGGPLDIEDFDPVGLVNTGPPLPNDKAIIVRLNTDAPNPVVPSSDPGAIGQVSYGDGFGQTGSVDSTQYLASTSKVVTLQLCLTKDDAKIGKFRFVLKTCPGCALVCMNFGVYMMVLSYETSTY